MAWQHYELGDYVEAKRIYDRARAGKAATPEEKEQFATAIMVLSGQLDAAVECMQEGLAVYREHGFWDGAVRCSLAEVLLESGDVEGAREASQRTLEDPKLSQAKLYLCRAHLTFAHALLRFVGNPLVHLLLEGHRETHLPALKHRLWHQVAARAAEQDLRRDEVERFVNRFERRGYVDGESFPKSLLVDWACRAPPGLNRHVKRFLGHRNQTLPGF